MGDSIMWFLLSCKRQLKKISFLAVLVLIPLLLSVVSGMENKKDDGIKIALYAKSGLEKETADVLVDLPGAFSFYLCGSEEELKADVETRRAECGYVFPDNFREKMEKNDFRRCIRLYSSPATVLGSMSQEVVFSAVMETYGPEILDNYGKIQSWDMERIGELYEKYSVNGSTFSFAYESAAGGEIEENSLSITFPGRGIGAVFLFITGIFAAASLMEDEKKGMFLCIPQEKKWWYSFLGILAPVLMEAAAVLVSLYLTGTAFKGGMGILKEICAILIYGAAIAAFTLVLKGIARKPEILIGSVPFFMIGSLALCPVFLDAGRWIPELTAFSRMFLPYYYLRLFI